MSGDLQLRAADGTRLLPTGSGPAKTAVVLAHQSDGTLCQWVPYAKRLAARGYTAIVFDFRNAGGSQIVPWTATRRLGGDVAAACTRRGPVARRRSSSSGHRSAARL